MTKNLPQSTNFFKFNAQEESTLASESKPAANLSQQTVCALHIAQLNMDVLSHYSILSKNFPP
jgi:hypothetical protein